MKTRTKQSGYRRGLSLLEVLISMFVLTIGLLGVAALIPLGRFAMVESGKADRSGACGHAALHEIKVRRMLDPYPWPHPPDEPPKPQWVYANGNDAVPAAFAAGSFAIDPLYVARYVEENKNTNVPNLGPIPRVSLRVSPAVSANPLPWGLALAEQVFYWHDDLLFSLPEDMEPPPATESDRPRASVDASGLPDFAGNYSWLVTVTPAAAKADLPVAEKTLYSVSVVACYRRDFSIDGEHTAAVTFLGSGWGGGSLRLDSVVDVRENEWIMLCGGNQCNWYRVVSAGEMWIDPATGNPDPNGTPVTVLTLTGPDWDTVASPSPTAVVIDQVVSVYTTTVEVESSVLWSK